MPRSFSPHALEAAAGSNTTPRTSHAMLVESLEFIGQQKGVRTHCLRGGEWVHYAHATTTTRG